MGQLNYDKEKLTIHADPETIIVKLAPAVSAEMEKLLEEEAAEKAVAAAETAVPAEGEAPPAPAEGEQPQEQLAEAGEEPKKEESAVSGEPK